MKSQEEILRKTEAFVEEQLAGEASGHDWWHIVRVRNMALNDWLWKKAQIPLFVS